MAKVKLLPKVKLKHLEIVSRLNPDYSKVMTEVVGYKNNWISRKWRFIKDFKTAFVLTNEVRNIDPSQLQWKESCPIKKPKDIDFISFRAMMELQALLGVERSESEMLDVISSVIATACYSSNNEGDFDSESKQYQQFLHQILNHSFVEMFGLYNWIMQDLQRSTDQWNERFFSVELVDKDYEQAGGSRMGQFNIISSIKSICSDFNIPFEAAWQMSYNLIQTNSYAKATQNHIQDNMRILKESRMRESRRS